MNVQEVTTVAQLQAHPEHREELLQLLFEIIERSRISPECFCYDLYHRADNENVFLLLQTWGTREAFETNWLHIDAPKLKTHAFLLQAPIESWEMGLVM